MAGLPPPRLSRFLGSRLSAGLLGFPGVGTEEHVSFPLAWRVVVEEEESSVSERVSTVGIHAWLESRLDDGRSLVDGANSGCEGKRARARGTSVYKHR